MAGTIEVAVTVEVAGMLVAVEVAGMLVAVEYVFAGAIWDAVLCCARIQLPLESRMYFVGLRYEQGSEVLLAWETPVCGTPVEVTPDMDPEEAITQLPPESRTYFVGFR